jgi:hypothetical protein
MALGFGPDDIEGVVVGTGHQDGQAGTERGRHLDGAVDSVSCGGRPVGAHEYALQHERRP